MKLLVIDLKNPENSHYSDPHKIASFMMAKTVKNYPMFAVSDDLKVMEPILTTTCDCVELQLQVLGQIHHKRHQHKHTQ